MSKSSNHGGLKSFEPTESLNKHGFIHKKWNGQIYPPFFDPKAIEYLRENWETQENDIFICSHQKVGTHLTKKFISEILRFSFEYPKGGGMATGDIGHGTIPWPEVMVSQHGIDHFLEFIDRTKELPRLWYTHCAWYDLPFRSAHAGTKFIHVFRDPRGAFVSQYHFYRSHPMLGVSDNLSIDEFIDMFNEGKMYFGDYHQHTLDWIANCRGKIDPKSLLVLRYEDLVERKIASAKKISEFILSTNLPSEHDLERIVGATEFDTMKKEILENPQTFHFNPNTFFREGKTYGWMEKLTSEQISKLDQKSENSWGEGHVSHPDMSAVNTL